MKYTRRSTFVFVVILVWSVVVVSKLFYWQVLSYDDLATQAVKQHFTTFTLPASRGDILSSDESILVTNQPAYLLYAEPNKIKNVSEFAKSISSILKIPESSVSAKIQNQSLLWAQIASKVEEERIDQIKELKLEGIGFEKVGKRYYPEASMSAHLLGFVASDSQGSDKGYFGLEGFYDNELRGREGFIRQEKDPFGFPIVIGEGERIDPANGRNLKTHIDKMVQYIIEDKLNKGIEKFGAKGGTVVVMDPATGGVISMVASPSYDPASYAEYDKELYRNPMVADTYEPGSTFKTLIMAAAINEGLIQPQTKVNETGPVEIAGYKIRTWNNEYHGDINMTEVLQYSSNVGMVFVQRKLGKDKMLEYLDKFGLGKLTKIDLQDETTSFLRAKNEWTEIDLATASFGQGIAVTPIQMVRAVSSIANGGKLMEPHVVSEVIDSQGSVKSIKPKVVKQVLKESTTKILTEMMVASVESGEAHYKIPKGFKIAGKTGTAQIPVAGHYDAEKTIASFVGFAPAHNPKFVMLVAIREPKSSPWGSETAAPLFMDIAQELFLYYKLNPE